MSVMSISTLTKLVRLTSELVTDICKAIVMKTITTEATSAITICCQCMNALLSSSVMSMAYRGLGH